MSRPRTLFKFTSLAVAVIVLAACGTSRPPNVSGHYKVGAPYQIKGKWYTPKEDYSYDETGIASWYGADFHDMQTANGETFNKDELTAAHPTLPMPSLARVTNLDNGKSIVVRINDRGPFSGARIIDVSQRCAQLLDFEKRGTAKVRVQVLADESKAIADALRIYKGPEPQFVPESEPAAPQPVVTAAVTSEPLPPPPSTPKAEPAVATAPVPAPIQVASTQPVAMAPMEPVPAPVKVSAPPQSEGHIENGVYIPSPSSSNVLKLPTNYKLPKNDAEAHAMLATIKPVPEVKQVRVTGKNQIFVQAGAFTSNDNAVKLKQKMKKLGTASVVSTTVKGVTYYRVRLGPVADVDRADQLLNRVKNAGASSAKIVVD